MKFRVSNRSTRVLTLCIEPNPDHYELEAGGALFAEGDFEIESDGSTSIDCYDDEDGLAVVLYGLDDVVVTKEGVRIAPWEHKRAT